ncbi:hypothetical protein Ais01nite_82790 [Asanoa ishikariensis]|uniref:Golgi phosphoprotein 3 (GPP34) n=1 Tax=Asanoa ishikariensis TaxID=137265 RepID=A0A1H3S9P7_9ACTN|nr:GPP34 family phosphoprotein [Asanoa ishikariensis]GIF70244.1 hypothetical protein Ais01nite_82790 [Asanoa ishikariensis]SDZ34823.1 Golgi phosphoprotein 3 (GPP34) [Asanoa ishikariensis]
MTVSLAEDLLLLGYEDDGTPTPDSGTLDYGLAGAVLVELATARRIKLAGGRVRVDKTETGAGDPILDHGLQRITGYGREAKPGELLDAIRGGLRDLVLDRLVDRGVLLREQRRVLLVPLPRFPSATGGEPPAETETRARLTALIDGGTTDERTHTLATLALAAGLTSSAFPGVPRADVERCLAALPEPWQSTAVRELLDEVQVSIIATTTMFMTGS